MKNQLIQILYFQHTKLNTFNIQNNKNYIAYINPKYICTLDRYGKLTTGEIIYQLEMLNNKVYYLNLMQYDKILSSLNI